MSENVQTFSGKVNVADNLLVGTSHFFVDRQNNRVGIGTSTPDASSMLDVTGNIKSGGTITATGGFSGNGSGLSGVNSDSGSWVKDDTNGLIYVANSAHKVGIGTTSPQRLLHLKRSGAATFQRIQNVNNNNGCGIELMRGDSDTWGATSWSDWRISNTEHLDFGVKFTGTDIPSVLHLNTDGDVAFGTSTVVDSRALLHIKNHVGGIAFQASTNSNSRNWRIRNDDLADHGSFMITVSDNNSSHPSSASHAVMTMLRNRRVGIGTTNPGAILEVVSGTEIPRLRGDAGRSLFMGSHYTHVNSSGFSETNGAYAWGGYPGVVRMNNNNGEYRVHGEGGSYTVTVRADGGFATFTGSHDTFTPFSEDDVGKIVYSTGNYATEVKDGNVNGVIYDYLTVMDSCPVVKICATENDKRVMGVLSTRHERTQIEEITKEEYELITGDERYAYEKKEGSDVYIRDIDTGEFSRGYYNAVGEGGIWVCNKNGNFENGDYITSSTVTGYGQKQNDDLLHNYTVAKITTDCDFTEIWVTTKKHKKTRDGYLFDENNEPIYENIVPSQTHLKFKLRYLLPDGSQISEEEYTTKAMANEEVYIAAFVGCTYHCG